MESNAVVEMNAQQPVPSTVTSPMEMLSVAVQNGAAADVLERLMSLQERWQGNQARMAFTKAMSDAKADIGPITKTQTVDFTSKKGRTNYRFEDLATIDRQIAPILAENGLSYRFRSDQQSGMVSVTCIVAHEDGYSEETTLTAGVDQSGNKNHIQAIGSAVTYLQRYTLKVALGLSASVDDDAQSCSPSHQARQQKPEPEDTRTEGEKLEDWVKEQLPRAKTIETLDTWMNKFSDRINALQKTEEERFMNIMKALDDRRTALNADADAAEFHDVEPEVAN